MRLKFWRRARVDDGIQHGRPHNYSSRTRRCRCTECTRAFRDYKRAWEAKVRAEFKATGKLPAYVSHGTRNAYNAYGCRCDLCREAASEYAAAQYMKAMAAK